jgi:hypothetical protein
MFDLNLSQLLLNKDFAICPTARHRARQKLMDGAISFVKRYSRAAAKPIEYEAERLRNTGLGIKSLW